MIDSKADIHFKGKFSRELFQTLWFAYRKHSTLLCIFLVFGFLGRVLLLGNANIIGIWVDSFCQDSLIYSCKATPNLFVNFKSQDFLSLLFAMSVVGFLFSLLFRVGFSVVSARAVSQLYDETTLRTSRYPMSFFDKQPTGRIVTRFSSDYGNVFRLFGGPLAEFLSIIFDLTAMIVLIGVASALYLPAIVFVALLNYLVFRLNRDRLRTNRRALSASRSPSIAHFSETTQGASTIRTFRREKSFALRFAELDSMYLDLKRSLVKNIMLFSFQMNSLTAILLLTTGMLASYFIHQGLLSIGSLGVAFGFVSLSGNTVQMFFEWLAQFEEAMTGVERLDNYLRLPIEVGAKLPAETSFATAHWIRGKNDLPVSQWKNFAVSVEFKNVSFRYGPDLPLVLNNVSLRIDAGSTVGIIGRTGSGKSSLMQTLMHLYPIESGTVLIDGKEPMLGANDTAVNHIDLDYYRSAIGYISQDPILLRGTLLENLAGTETVDQSKIFLALQKVGLEKWADSNGLQFWIEEKGKNLSLGEKQLICMARCLLQNRPVVVMDEATSSVDPKSEELMVQATLEIFAGRTQIIIAHRLTTLSRCDRIIWLQDGKVRASGPPSAILTQFKEADLTLV